MYNRFDATVHERENVTDVLSALTDHNSSLEDHIKLLERRVQELGRLLGRPVAAISQKLQGLLSAESIHCLSSLLESDLSQSSTLNDHDTPISILNDGMESGDGNKLEDNSDDKESGFDDGSSLSKSHMMSDSIIRADGLDNVTLDQIYQEMDSVAINLKTLRNRLQCSCSLPFQHYSKRYHCWKCGNVFCSKCILRHTPLAGHYSQKPVPICKDCYKVIRNTKSMSSLQKYCDEQLSVTDNPSSLSSDTLDSVAS
ncbi:MTMR6 [Bugula neritina]|uniref:MTMR6 n=1 Tax=Bugula neritina TaxID=10212 RepID=A0A7J7IRH0_BUGNE|nr:MTMR6 [Bugula neritina]